MISVLLTTATEQLLEATVGPGNQCSVPFLHYPLPLLPKISWLFCTLSPAMSILRDRRVNAFAQLIITVESQKSDKQAKGT